MKTKSKALLLALCAVLLVAASVLGTLAYLTSQDQVTNTFTVGKVAINLDEAPVDANGKATTDARVKANQYHLLPGHVYDKDPTVTVVAGSEAAYVRMTVKVENIDKLKGALNDVKYYGTDGTFLLQSLCGGWDPAVWEYEKYTESTDGKIGTYEFRYKEVVSKSENSTVLDALFKTITLPGEITNESIKDLGTVKVVVNAHAIQADGFADADKAWTAFDAQNS